MKRRLKKLLPSRAQNKDLTPSESTEAGVPRITNETVAAHREEVLSKARKYIYPLEHSKHRIVTVSATLFIVSLAVFFIYCVAALYKLESSSTFLYRVTQVIPFPVARTGSSFVSYENYLFELRHYMHFHKTQQKVDFTSESGKQQLADFKKRALDKVVDDAIIKQLAKKHGISVSNQEVDDNIKLLNNQRRLGGSSDTFEDALKENVGWSISDFKRTLKQQLLAQKVLEKLDTETTERARAAHTQLKNGADFAELAKQVSDDPATKGQGGDFGFAVDKTNRDFSAQTTEVLFRLQPNEFSEPINVGYGLQIVKNLGLENEKARGAHIIFTFKDINTFVNDVKDQQKARLYLRL